MCTSPIRIKNRTKLFLDGTRRDILVPCGHCEECRASQAEQYYQRIMCEINDCHAHGGKVIFATPTYNNISVPRFYYTDELTGEQRSFMCFNKQHKDKFNHDIIQFFQRRYNLSNANFDYPFKSFIACEYGNDETRTMRPHLHGLWFIPREYLEAFGENEHDWKELFKRFWEYAPNYRGFMRFSPGNSIFVDSDFAGLYVSKYVGKDLNFYNNPDVKAFTLGMTRSKTDSKFQSCKHVLPTHWQSIHFGEGLIRYYDNVEAFVNGLDFNKILPLKSELEKGKCVLHQVPKYIERKLCYERDIHGREVLNNKGKYYKAEKFLRNISKIADKYLRACSKDEIKFKLQLDNQDVINSQVLKQFDTVDKLAEFLSHNLHSREKAIELALYNQVWTGISSFHNPSFVKDNFLLSNASHSEFVRMSKEQYVCNICANIDDSTIYIFRENGVFFDKKIEDQVKKSRWIDFIPRFRDFQLLLDIISEINCIYRNKRHLSYLRDRNIRKQLKFA